MGLALHGKVIDIRALTGEEAEVLGAAQRLSDLGPCHP